MIYDEIRRLDRYRGIHPNLDTAIDAILHGVLDTRKKGRNVIDGDLVYFSYPGDMRSKPVAEAKIEGHRICADIHMLFADEEILGYTPAGNVREKSYTEKFDFAEYEGVCDTFVTLRPGMFVIFFPGEPHQPLITRGEPRAVDKVIFKVHLAATKGEDNL